MISVIQKQIPWFCQVRPCSSKSPDESTRPVKIQRKKAALNQSSTHKKEVYSPVFSPNRSISEIIDAYPEKMRDLSRKLDDHALQQANASTTLQRQVNETFFRLQRCLQYDSRTLVMIGSASNSLLRKGSDIDIVLMPFADSHSNQEFRQKFCGSYKKSYLYDLATLLRKSKVVSNKSLKILLHARIPIIQFHARNGFKVDIQFCNPDVVVSSYAIGCSLRHDLRVRALILWLSSNFSAYSLKGSTRGRFSTYHICSLVIHFLRTLPLPILPDFYSCLPSDPFDSWKLTLNHVPYQGDSNDEVDYSTPSSHLLVKMIDYYAQINLHDIGLNTAGGYVEKKHNKFDLYLFDPCITTNEEGQCRVIGASTLISKHFTRLKVSLENGDFSRFV